MPASSTYAALGAHGARQSRRRAAEPRPRPDARPFDPRHSARLAPSHRRALVLVYESFTRVLTTTLAGQLRGAVTVSVTGVEQHDYAGIVAGCSDPTWIAAVGLGEGRGSGVLEVSIPLAMMLVDRLLGGPGTGPHPDRGLTDLEESLMAGVIDALLVDLTAAFSPLLALAPTVDRVEAQAELLKGAPPAQAFVVTTLNVELNGIGGALGIGLPLALLEPAFEAFAGSVGRVDDRRGEPTTVAEHLLDVAVDVRLRFHPVAVRAADVVALSEGTILPLNHRSTAPLALEIEGVPFLTAQPGRLGRRLACVVVEAATERGVPLP